MSTLFYPGAFSFSSKIAFMVEIIVVIIIIDRVNDNDNSDNV